MKQQPAPQTVPLLSEPFLERVTNWVGTADLLEYGQESGYEPLTAAVYPCWATAIRGPFTPQGPAQGAVAYYPRLGYTDPPRPAYYTAQRPGASARRLADEPAARLWCLIPIWQKRLAYCERFLGREVARLTWWLQQARADARVLELARYAADRTRRWSAYPDAQEQRVARAIADHEAQHAFACTALLTVVGLARGLDDLAAAWQPPTEAAARADEYDAPIRALIAQRQAQRRARASRLADFRVPTTGAADRPVRGKTPRA